MVKIGRHVTIEHEVYVQARAKHINISEAAESGIRSALNMKDINDKVADEDARIKIGVMCLTDFQQGRCKEDIGKANGHAAKWAKIIKYKSGETLTEKELVKVFG